MRDRLFMIDLLIFCTTISVVFIAILLLIEKKVK